MENNDFKIDFVGIGTMKAATTWIYECLGEHPEIEIAPKDQKDKTFFFKKNPSRKEIQKYQSWFKKKDTLKGDFHVHYLEAKEVPERIKAHNPDIKIIACLREPVKRAWSHYNYYKFSSSQPNITFKKALKKEPKILKTGLYYKHLQKYYDRFDEEDILILLFDDIKKDKLEFIQNIYEFLGVKKDFVPPSLDVQINLTAFKQTKMGNLLHNKLAKPLLEHTKWAWEFKKLPLVKKIIGRFSELWPKDKEKKKMNPKIEEKLRSYYKKDIEKLEQLTGRNLSTWKRNNEWKQL